MLVRRLAPVLVAAAVLTACTAKPENSPVIRKKFAEVDELKTNIDKSSKQLEEIASQLTLMRDEMSNLRALTPGSDGAVEVVNRLEQIEQRLSKLDGAKVVASVVPAANKEGAPADALATANELAVPKTTVDAAKTEVAKAEPKKEAAAAPAAKKTTPTTQVKNTKPAAPVAAKPAAPRGKYYTIQANDTLDKIARDNGISVTTLAKENRLPAGARPLKGQRIFIPAAK